MGKKTPAQPAAPNPAAQAAAQTQTNKDTAIYNTELGFVDQVTPDGTLRYAQHTTSGNGTPRYTAYVDLSPEQAAIKAQDDAASLNLSTLANKQSGFLQDYMAGPVSLDNDAVESRIMELGRKRLDPLLAERAEAERTRQANRGVKQGSDAYDRAMTLNSQAENDAYTSLLLGGRNQAVQEILTERNQPINEITALLSGSQVSQPQFVGTSTAQAPTTDVAGIYQQNYANRMGAFNAANARNDALMGGLFQAGGAIGAAALSDIRAKKDIRRVGEAEGHNVYTFRYMDELSTAPLRFGVMAQEVAETNPEAVSMRPDGFMQVDYAQLFGGAHV